MGLQLGVSLSCRLGFLHRPSCKSAIGLKGVSMTSLHNLSDEQFQSHSFEVLKRELGAGGLARFLRLRQSGAAATDYTRDRDEWQKDLTVDVEAILERRRGATAK